MSLAPCTACRRHVRHESACPFCGAALESRTTSTARALPRMGRAAILAFGTTLAASACGSSTATEPAETSGGESPSADPTAPTRQPGTTPPPDDGGGVVPLYGTPD